MTDSIGRLRAALADRYRIERELGQGGMAAVYLAHDIKHDRKVALKVLKPELAAVIGAERFVVEIKTTAALQHPNILPLFDSGEADSFLYYVMPFVDGETLRAKLDRETQLGVEDAVQLTRDVADALHYAHTRGVIHRDIKPENILLANGRPMVADFGIALALSAAAGGRMTETGLSLGTPHYMSPEQATAEKDITARSDVYSLASVLYEMLTGNPPHTGASAQQIIMKIITEQAPGVTTLRKSVPVNVSAAIAKALEKLPADRFVSASDFASALVNPGFTTGTAAARIVTSTGQRRHVAIAWAVASAATAIAAWLALGSTTAASTPVQFVLVSATARPVMTYTWPAVISPDGQQIVYAGEAGTGQYQLYVRRVDGLDARPLPSSVGGTQATFSADGKWIAYLSGGQLLKAQVSGGVPVALTPANANNGMTWLPRGELVLGSEGAISGLARISDDGGAPTALTSLDPNEPSSNHVWPVVLDDGATIVFSIWPGSGKTLAASQLATTSIDDGVVRRLGITAVRALGVADGYLIYLKVDGTVMAVPFDGTNVKGAAVPVLDSISLCRTCNGDAPISLSASGGLAYIRGALPKKLVWVDTAGGATAISSREDAFSMPRLSPDGRRIVVTINNRMLDVWVYEIATATWTQVTRGGNNYNAEWTADGAHLVYASDNAGTTRAMRVSAQGSGVPEVLVDSSDGLKHVVPSSDGSVLLLNAFRGNNPTIWSRFGKDSIVPFAVGDYWIGHGRFSHDGKRVAYASYESGINQVYVRSFGGKGAALMIFTGGGSEPVWSRDGRRLYYGVGLWLTAATLAPPPDMRVITRDSLFVGEGFGDFDGATYDVAADGKHFLMLQTDARNVQLVIALNWASTLRARVAGK